MLTIYLILFFATPEAYANVDGAYLDPLYKNLVHPTVDQSFDKGVNASNTEDLIQKMTAVKSQGSRGTCSIFSATAMLEGMLIIKRNFSTDIDLSEEYMEYLAVRNKTSDGSYSGTNFGLIARYGLPLESTMPYDPSNWDSSPWLPQIQARCGHLDEGNKKKSCMLIHRDPDQLKRDDRVLLDNQSPYYDPDFVEARNEAINFRNKNISFYAQNYNLYRTSYVKKALNMGIPVTLGIEFFYGAWNHRKAQEMGINRSLDGWNKGIVGYPEPGSVDRKESRKNPAGHSILIVGYDDNKIVEVESKMQDGSVKTFRYKGVYYFKNSWGTDGFGAGFSLNNKTYKGYGMITQKHAHEHGSFYYMPLK